MNSVVYDSLFGVIILKRQSFTLLTHPRLSEFVHFCRAMLCISAAYAVLRCVCVSVCVCHVCGSCQNE